MRFSKYFEFLRSLSTSSQRLRFNRRYVTVSEIAQQFYCEEKLRLSIIEGKVETEATVLGTLIHENLLRGEELSLEELLRRIESGYRVVASLPLVGIIDEIPIVGIPDAIVFINGIASIVIELKTSNKWLDTVFKTEYVQAQTYAYLLHELNIASKNLIVSIAKLKRDPEYVKSKRLEILKEILKILDQVSITPIIIHKKDLTIHCMPFDESIIHDIKWALAFWKMERELQPTSSLSRCLSCEYRHICSLCNVRKV